MDQKAREAVEKVDSCRDGRDLFRTAKQRVREKMIWKEHMEKLMNVESEWSNSIGASKIEGAMRRNEVEEVWCAMSCMKIGKASGPSGAVIELFKAGGETFDKHI